MKTWGRRVGYGAAVWALLYALSIPLLGLQTSDPMAFKAVMASLGSFFGAIAAGLYFLPVTGGYLREGVTTALVWMILNWGLDIVALLPFTHETIPQYFMHIGIEYVGMFGMLVAIGYILEKKSKPLS